MAHGWRKLGGMFATMFGGRRNLYDVFGYSRNPTFSDCMAKYVRQDIAARVIDAPAAALWTNPPQIIAEQEDWNIAWLNLVIQCQLWERIERLDKLAGLGKYSIVLIGFNDGLPLDQPVNPTKVARSDRKVLYLQPYSVESAEIQMFEDNHTSEHYMKPKMYLIDPKNEIAPLSQPSKQGAIPAKGLSKFQVHHSRVLHICENPLENDVFGAPRLERVYNILDDLLKVTGGTAETFWLTGNRGMQVDIDKDMELDPGDEKALAAELDEYSQNLRRVIRTRGVKINNLGSDNPDPTGTFNVLIQMLSGATGIPRRILTGSEAGQLASDQDRANWADRIDERRSDFGNPIVLIPLLAKLSQYGALPIPEKLVITINWPNAFKLSPLENAQTSAQHARSATNFAKAIETMYNLNLGTPGSEGVTDPETGAVSGAVAAIPGADLGDLISIDEARKMIGLDKPENTIDGVEDLLDPKKLVRRGRPPITANISFRPQWKRPE